MSRKHTIEEVQSLFHSEGYTLLSTEYFGNKCLLEVRCPKGHLVKIRYGDFRTGHRCPVCYGTPRHTLEYISQSFLEEGYTLLSTTYVNCKLPIKYLCPKGHQHTTTFGAWRNGRRCPTCRDIRRLGSNNGNWKGGCVEGTSYDTYAERLSIAESVHAVYVDGFKMLGVECAYCGKVFVPGRESVLSRLRSLDGKSSGECRFYCSNQCKRECPIYGRRKHLKGHKFYRSREVQPELRRLVFARDLWTCQSCKAQDVPLHCHHIDPVNTNPIESADIDNCVTLCAACHLKIHQKSGCKYNELKCKE